jgi:hypothetical protein
LPRRRSGRGRRKRRIRKWRFRFQGNACTWNQQRLNVSHAFKNISAKKWQKLGIGTQNIAISCLKLRITLTLEKIAHCFSKFGQNCQFKYSTIHSII